MRKICGATLGANMEAGLEVNRASCLVNKMPAKITNTYKAGYEFEYVAES
jgi:hypothetical protein